MAQRRKALIAAATALSQELAQAGVHDEFTRKWVPEKWLPRLAAGRVDAPSKTLISGVEEGQWAKKNDAAGAAAIAPFQGRLEALAEMEATAELTAEMEATTGATVEMVAVTEATTATCRSTPVGIGYRRKGPR